MKTNQEIERDAYVVAMLWAFGFAALLIAMSLTLTGCTVVTNDRVFPKVTWYWSAEAKQQRNERKPTLPVNPSTETQPK
jgi:type IV secretory pathway VirB3-like protein